MNHILKLLSELFSVFVSFSIFAVTWFAYSRSKDNHALFLGAAFFVIGLFDIFHSLSYPFMPDFITPNSSHKSAIFWSLARLVSAPLFLISVFIYKDTLPRLINKAVLFLFIVLTSIAAFLLLFYHDYLPAIVYPSGSTSIARILSITISLVFILYSSYLYRERVKKTGETNLTNIIYGFIIVLFSDFIYFSYEITGHLLKVSGFYFIFLAAYKSSVEQPYERLAIAEERLLNVAEEKYRNLFDNATDAILTHDLEGRILSWNKSAERIFGWKADEVTGKEILPLMVPPHLQAERKEMVCNTMEGIPVAGTETVCLRRDGTGVDVSLTVSPLLDANRAITGISCIIRDITGRKKAEELRLENERLVLANQAKSEFLAIMSHELRTPLNSILGFSELLRQKKAGELNEKQENYVDNVISSGKHLLNLINGILDLSRIEARKMEITVEKIHVPEAVDGTLNLLKINAEKRNVIFKKEIDPRLEFIEADDRQFKQVLFNLLSNAVKFSKLEGGIVTIRATKSEDTARFSVSDTGIGIKEENMVKIFRAFQQLDSGISRKYGGTGLGLAISKQLVELHGGKIHAESKYGEGSTFTFTLPLKAKEESDNTKNQITIK